jgi:hypothetical protein
MFSRNSGAVDIKQHLFENKFILGQRETRLDTVHAIITGFGHDHDWTELSLVPCRNRVAVFECTTV